MMFKVLLIFTLCISLAVLPGCGVVDEAVSGVSTMVGLSDTATVIAKTAQIRTSYAVVAADLRATPPQDAGQLRAASNRRLAPDMSPENILFKLANASTFEIMDWQFVPKQEEVADVDDAAKGEQRRKKRTRNEEIEAAREAGEPEKLDEKYDIWYRVKLDRSVSPAPAGWLFGRQVELQVPSDLVFYQHNNRKFIAWQRLDTDSGRTVSTDKMSAPGNWVVLSRSNVVRAIDGVEPEFDGIIVFAFD